MNDTVYGYINVVLSPLRGYGFRRFAAVRWALGAIKPNVTMVRGRKFFLDPLDFVVSEQIRAGGYEAVEVALVEKLVRPKDSIVDLGANIGFFTTLFCELAPEGHVYAFEPNPQTFQLLQKNIRMRGCTNARLHEMAVSNADGETELYINEYNRGDNRLYPSFDAKGVMIRTVQLDSVIAEGEHVDLIKMDIQGYEVFALRGMRRVLRENPDLILVVECWPRGLKEAGTSSHQFFDELKRAGFEWRVISQEDNSVREMGKDEYKNRYTEESGEYANLL